MKLIVTKTVIDEHQCYVISDLHLAEGDLGSGQMLGTENFQSDREFAAFILHLKKESKQPICLIINGDFVDFIRITGIPSEKQFDEWRNELIIADPSFSNYHLEALGKTEIKYGLRTNDYKSVWKLYLAIMGHESFFTAMANFVDEGNSLIINVGNHDPEWYWTLVQDYMREKLYLLSSKNSAKSNFIKKIRFSTTAMEIYDTILIDHGHNFEKVTACHPKYELHLVKNLEKSWWQSDMATPMDPRKRELHLSFGSIINRYLLNRTEKEFPYIDNLDTGKSVFTALLNNNLGSVYKILFNYLNYMWRSLSKDYSRLMWYTLENILVPLLPIGLFVYLLNETELFQFEFLPAWASTILKWLSTALGPLVLRHFLKMFLRWTNVTDAPLEESVMNLIQKDPNFTKYSHIVVGHNHQAYHILGDDKKEYLNTGTWTSKYVYKYEKIDTGLNITTVRIQRTDSGNKLSLLKYDAIANTLTSFVSIKKYVK